MIIFKYFFLDNNKTYLRVSTCAQIDMESIRGWVTLYFKGCA